jgi:hypothetical protein
MLSYVAVLVDPSSGYQTADIYGRGRITFTGYYCHVMVLESDEPPTLWVWVNQSIANSLIRNHDLYPKMPAVLCGRLGDLYDPEDFALAGLTLN